MCEGRRPPRRGEGRLWFWRAERRGESRAQRLPALTAVPCRAARPAEATALGAEGRRSGGSPLGRGSSSGREER